MRCLFPLLAAVVLLLAGCCGTPVAAVPASASPCAAAPVPVAMAPQVAGYELTPVSYGRAALQIPGNLITCVGTFARCAADALFPEPVPTAVYAGAPVAAAAAPCAPAAPAPQLTYVEREVTELCPETYTENVPVQRTRMVPRTRTERVPMMLVPAGQPQAAPCAPAAPAAPCVPPEAPPAGVVSGSASDPLAFDPCPNDACPGGCCALAPTCR
jgi:hypothetical protein